MMRFLTNVRVLSVGKRALPLAVLLVVLPPFATFSVPPAWWSNVTNGDSATDYAAVNQGQLKNFARKAYDEVRAKLPSDVWITSEGIALKNLVASWYDDPSTLLLPKVGADYALINQGQLKNVAKPFYDLLTAQGTILDRITEGRCYPWTENPDDSANYAVVNLGQLKNVFSFLVDDRDGDGLPDEWELHNGLDPGNPNDGNGDLDGDGIDNAHEYALGTDPLLAPVVSPGLTPPLAPSNVEFVLMPDGGRYVYWKDNATNESYFVIRETKPDGTVVELGRVGPGVTSFYVPPKKP